MGGLLAAGDSELHPHKSSMVPMQACLEFHFEAACVLSSELFPVMLKLAFMRAVSSSALLSSFAQCRQDNTNADGPTFNAWVRFAALNSGELTLPNIMPLDLL